MCLKNYKNHHIQLSVFVINRNQCIFKTHLFNYDNRINMNEHLRLQKEKIVKRLVSNSKSILSNQIGLPLGVMKMGTLITWLNNIEAITNINLDIIKDTTRAHQPTFSDPKGFHAVKIS
jgi:hypothetical protein